jgi:ribosomal protein S18 acetylase RimI-like enzyme
MPPPDLQLDPNPSPAEARGIEDRIDAFNVEATGIPFGGPVSCVWRDEGGAVVAGITGYVWGECCHVQFLWVHEARRGGGLGTRLLAFAEEEAARRGCRQVVLETYTFQAPEFYRRAGYEEMGRVSGHPAPPHEHLFLRKRLREAAPGVGPRAG